MDDLAARAKLIATARSLLLRDGDKFTVSSLCKESGLNRTKLRRTFPRKAKLISAVLSELLAESGGRQGDPTPTTTSDHDKSTIDGLCSDRAPTCNNSDGGINDSTSQSTLTYMDDEWIERRFRVVERAVDALERRIETRCGEQSNSIREVERAVDVLERRTETSCSDQFNAIALLEKKLASVINSPIDPATLIELPQLIREQEQRESIVEAVSITSAEIGAKASASVESAPRAEGGEGCGQQPNSIGILEQRLAGATNSSVVPAAIIDPPPLISELRQQEPGIEEDTIPNVEIEPETSASVESTARSSSDAQLKRSPTRAKMVAIFQNAQGAANQAPPTEHHLLGNKQIRLVVWTAIACIILLMMIAGLSSPDNRIFAKEAPAPKAKHHIQELSSVAVIDASGIPNPQSNEIPLGLRDLIAQAKGGKAQAQTALAEAFLRGGDEERNPLAAVRWSQVAAEQGEPSAQFILGTLYSDGIEPNPRLAVQWFFAAASQGNVKAMHNLGIAFLNGQGVTKDSVMAANWFSRAANLGYRDSEFDLAVLYERGEGVAQSPQDALRWYDKASSSGDQEAARRASFLRSNLPYIGDKKHQPIGQN